MRTEKWGEKDQLFSLFAGNMSAACLQKVQPKKWHICLCVCGSVEKGKRELHSPAGWHQVMRAERGRCSVSCYPTVLQPGHSSKNLGIQGVIILEVATRNVHEASLKLLYQLVNYCMPVPFPQKFKTGYRKYIK